MSGAEKRLLGTRALPPATLTNLFLSIFGTSFEANEVASCSTIMGQRLSDEAILEPGTSAMHGHSAAWRAVKYTKTLVRDRIQETLYTHAPQCMR